MRKIPGRPTKELVNRYLQEFSRSERYFLSDQAITKLFGLLPNNNNLNDVLLKVTVLNDLYGTNNYGTFEMAHHIVSLDIDDELRRQSHQVVDRIANVLFKGKLRHVFSFATKYCSWHDKENYPIYDAYVERLLLAYCRKDEFAEFQKPDLRIYASYKTVITKLREYYELTEYSFKQLDKFLWLYGKHLYPKKYLNKTTV